MMRETLPYKPGIHSYNASRLAKETQQQTPTGISRLKVFLVLVGVVCLSYYAYIFGNQRIYQVYENWAFDQQIAGRAVVTFRDYIRERTPFRFFAGSAEATRPTQPPVQDSSLHVPATGSVIGRVAIGRLNVSSVVRQGVDDKTLQESVGHVPSTALAGQAGNFAIAAHRDTLFRALKDIQKGDVVTFQSPTGVFSYQVVATKIVRPTDVSVLRPDGGGLIANPGKLLTMITCYPFYYVGSAPKRFVVEAQMVDGTEYRDASQRN